MMHIGGSTIMRSRKNGVVLATPDDLLNDRADLSSGDAHGIKAKHFV